MWRLWTITREGGVAKRFAIHPGEILRTEFMEPMGLSSYRVAKELGVPLPRVYDVVKGKRAITADTALRLGAFFGLPAQFWLNLQNEYDLRMADVAGVGRIRRFKAA
jgi:addiction module HigA family antidote